MSVWTWEVIGTSKSRDRNRIITWQLMWPLFGQKFPFYLKFYLTPMRNGYIRIDNVIHLLSQLVLAAGVKFVETNFKRDKRFNEALQRLPLVRVNAVRSQLQNIVLCWIDLLKKRSKMIFRFQFVLKHDGCIIFPWVLFKISSDHGGWQSLLEVLFVVFYQKIRIYCGVRQVISYKTSQNVRRVKQYQTSKKEETDMLTNGQIDMGKNR